MFAMIAPPRSSWRLTVAAALTYGLGAIAAAGGGLPPSADHRGLNRAGILEQSSVWGRENFSRYE